jgi:pilus assembly protein CpaB
MAIFLCSFLGLGISQFLAKDLPLFRSITSSPGQGPRDTATPSSLVPVVVAAHDISAGTWLTPNMFRLEPRAIQGIDEHVVKSLDQIAGTFARGVIVANTPLLKAAISKGASAAEITDRIPVGFRAVAIPVNALTGVEGWVQPGASVDVVWSIEREKQLTVSTIVENARVLSVERSLEPRGKTDALTSQQPNHITLLVSTTDAQKIQLAKGAGSLNLSLRGVEDSAATGDGTLTAESILARSNPGPVIVGRVRIDDNEYVLRGNKLHLADEHETQDGA